MASEKDLRDLIDKINDLKKQANRKDFIKFDSDQFKDAAQYTKDLNEHLKEVAEGIKSAKGDWDYITQRIKQASDNLQGNNRHLETARQAYSRIAGIAGQLEGHATQQSNLSILQLRTLRSRLIEEKKLLEQQLKLTDLEEGERQNLQERVKLTEELILKNTALIREEQKLSKILADQREMFKEQVRDSIKRNLEAISYGSILKGVWNQMNTLSDKTYENQINLGLSSTAAAQLTQNLRDSSLTMKNVTFTEAVTSNQELNDQFGVSTQFSDEMVQSQQQVKDLLGLTSEEAGKLASYTVLTGVKQNDLTKSIGKSSDKLLNNKKILKEVLSVEGQLAAQYKNDPRLLAKAVEQTTKIGLTLKQAADASRGLLDFESSIANELEAELLTGKDLNLEKARYLALQGDSAGAAKEMMREVGGLAEFQKMNVLQQDALAKSVGMTTDQLADAMKKEEEINKIRRDGGSTAIGRIEELKRQGKVEEAAQLQKSLAEGKSLDVAEKELSISKQMEKNKQRLQEALTNIVASPAVTMLSKVLNGLAGILASPVTKALLGIAGTIGIGMAAIGAVRSITGVVKNLIGGKVGESPMRPMYTRDVGGAGGSASADLGNLPGGANKLAKYARYAQMATAVAGIASTAIGSYMQGKADETRQKAAEAKAAGDAGQAAQLEKKAQRQETVGQAAGQTGEKSLWTQGISWLAGKGKTAMAFIGKSASNLNPLSKLSKILKAGSPKLFKVLAKLPYVGGFIESIMAAKDIAAMRSSGATQDEIDQMVGKRVLQGIGGLLGTAGGTALAGALTPFTGGASVLVQPLLAMGGDFIGRWLGGLLADSMGAKPVGRLVSGLFGKTGSDTPKKMAKGGIVTRATSIIAGEAGPEAIVPLSGEKGPSIIKQAVGGVAGGSAEVVNELRAIRQVLSQILAKEGDITLDGIKLGTALNISTRKLQ